MIVFFISCVGEPKYCTLCVGNGSLSSNGCYAAVTRQRRNTSRSDMTWQSHSPRRRRITLQNMILHKRLDSLVFC